MKHSILIGIKIIFLTASSFAQKSSLFDSDSILDIRITGELKELLRDRVGVPRNFPLKLKASSDAIQLNVNIRTRGHFRRTQGGCTYPPLLIQFDDKTSLNQSIFRGQTKLKMVMPCRSDEYIVREYMVYKLYQIFTPVGFKARLLRITFEDTKTNKTTESFYAFLIEDEDDMAQRNNYVSLERKVLPQQTMAKPFHVMAIFEYLIGNTDWSVQYQQNIKLVAKDTTSMVMTVPYDFDHAGIVNAPYALPAPELQLSSIRSRRYRGYCQPVVSMLDDALVPFIESKDKIYALYQNHPLLTEKYKKSTLAFLDEFYTIINNPKKRQAEFAYPCDPNGTGNVVIKGLKQ